MSPTGEAGIHADLLPLDPALFCSALLQHTMPWPSYSYIYSPIKHPLTHHRVESCLVAKTCLTLCDPMHCGLPSFSLMGFPGQEYWGWLPFASPEDLPDPGIKPRLLHWPDGFFATEPPGHCKHQWYIFVWVYVLFFLNPLSNRVATSHIWKFKLIKVK